MRPSGVAIQVLVIAVMNGVIGGVFWSLGYRCPYLLSRDVAS